MLLKPLCRLIYQQKICKNMKHILSFDIDRTLIDRNEFDPRFLNKKMLSFLEEISQNENIDIIFNSGRHLQQFPVNIDNIKTLAKFGLSGRLSFSHKHIPNNLIVDSSSVFNQITIDHINTLMQEDTIFLIDYKTDSSNKFLLSDLKNIKYSAHHRPLNWYGDNFIEFNTSKWQPTILNQEKIFKVELAFTAKNLYDSQIIFESIKNSFPQDNLSFSLAKSSGDKDLNSIFSVRIVKNKSGINKGIALKQFLDKYLYDYKSLIHFGDGDLSKDNDDYVTKQVMPESKLVILSNSKADNTEIQDLVDYQLPSMKYNKTDLILIEYIKKLTSH